MDDNRMKKLEDGDLESVSGGGFNSLDDIYNKMVDYNSICSGTRNRHKWNRICGVVFQCEKCGCYAQYINLDSVVDGGSMNLTDLAKGQ